MSELLSPHENQASAVFLERLRNYDEGSENTKAINPLRSPEGGYLTRAETLRLFRDVMKMSQGIGNKTILRHLEVQYLSPLFNKLRTAVAEVKKTNSEQNTQLRNSATAELILTMREMVQNPAAFGIDPEKQDTPRAGLQYTNEAGEHDGYNALETNLLGVPSEESNDYTVPDPFYVNGMLPTPQVIADACKRLYEKWYPENKGEELVARKLIKERCIDQIIRELEQVEQGRTKESLSFQEKQNSKDEIINKLTTLMRQLAQQSYMSAYVDMIAGGPYRSDVEFPADMIPLATFYKRPPYNLTEVLPAGSEKTEANIKFYREVYSNVSEADTQVAVVELQSGSNAFFRDEVGAISPTAAYVKMEMVFRECGFTDEQIQTSCAGYMAEVVAEMVAFENEYAKLHRERGEVEDVEALRALNQRISHMKANGRGELRKKLLHKAKQIVNNKDLITLMPISGDATSVATALENSSEQAGESQESIFAFDYGTLPDRDSRIIEGERFIKTVDEYIQPFFQSQGANQASEDAAYIDSRDQFSGSKTALSLLLQSEGVPAAGVVGDKIAAVEKVILNMIASIEAAAKQSKADLISPIAT